MTDQPSLRVRGSSPRLLGQPENQVRLGGREARREDRIGDSPLS